MKKKTISIVLLIVGIVLICVSIILTVVITSKANIIGGADWPTFEYIFFYTNRGLHFNLFIVGVISIIASLIVAKTNKQ